MLSKQTISNQDLNLILNSFNFRNIISIEPMLTSGNVSYIITTDIGKYFLRLSPDKGSRYRSINEIHSEIELLYHLRRNNFPVLLPIKSKDGRIIISIKNHNGYIRKFVEDNYKESPNPIEIEEFGKALGKFHSLTINFDTKNKREHIFDLEKTREFLEEDMRYILNSNFKHKEKFISRIKSVLSSMNFPEYLPSGMIHEDLGKRHILWNRNKISAIIDFDRSYFGKLVLDIGQACRGWCFTDNWSKWSNENFKHLIKGYSKRRKLSEIEKRYLVDAIKFGIIERAISFSLRFIGNTKDSEDEKYALYSVLENGLLDIVERNRTKIEDIVKEI
jgi:homoserine kinase type II